MTEARSAKAPAFADEKLRLQQGGGCRNDGPLPVPEAPDLLGMDRPGSGAIEMVSAIQIGSKVPVRLISQIAAEAGTTPHQVRLAIALSMVARRGGTIAEACRSIGRAEPTVKRVARRWIIDLADYRPFAAYPQRPAPIGRLH